MDLFCVDCLECGSVLKNRYEVGECGSLKLDNCKIDIFCYHLTCELRKDRLTRLCICTWPYWFSISPTYQNWLLSSRDCNNGDCVRNAEYRATLIAIPSNCVMHPANIPI